MSREFSLRYLVWPIIILLAFSLLLLLLFRIKKNLNPREYEGKIVEKWSGASQSQQGSTRYFRLVIEGADGKRTTVGVDGDTYDRSRVGMRIRKTASGIVLSQNESSSKDRRGLISEMDSAYLSRQHQMRF